MSKTITAKGGIYYDTVKHADLIGGRYTFFRGHPGNFGTYIFICPYELTFDLPEGFDPRPIEVQALEKKRAALQAEFTATVTEINRRISELQAITHEPAVTE